MLKWNCKLLKKWNRLFALICSCCVSWWCVKCFLFFWREEDWGSKKRGDKPTKGPLAVSDLLRLQVYWNISGRWYTKPNLTDRNNDFTIFAFKALNLQANHFQKVSFLFPFLWNIYRIFYTAVLSCRTSKFFDKMIKKGLSENY